jgi:hypothetical protein
MDLVARIAVADGGMSTLVGKSEVSMSGKAAAFGGRMMNTIADQVLQQFAANFANEVAARQAARTGTGMGGGSNASASAASPPRVNELNALALAWAVLKSWFRSLLGKSNA